MKDENIQDIVNQLSQDISRDAQFRDKVKKIFLLTLISSGLLTLLGTLAYLGYLNYSLHQVHKELAIKQNAIDDLESSLSSTMYAEQLREENALRILGDFKEEKENLKLEKKVLDNLKLLETTSVDHKGKNINRGNISFPEIALTFDLASGQDLAYVENLVRKYNINITIFLSNERASDDLGSLFIRSNVDSIKRLSKTGKVEFGNHTWSHYNYVRSINETSVRKRMIFEYISPEVLTLERMAEELNRVETTFLETTGQELKKFYRLPYGALNTLILNVHAFLGYNEHIMWSSNSVGSLDIPDYINKQFISKKDPATGKIVVKKNPIYKTSRETLDYLYNWERSDASGMNGAIILLHLGSPRKFDPLILILPEFIETMKKKGYHFRTVSEVLNDRLDS